MGYLVRAYYCISPTWYYKDDSCWSVDLKSKATEDIISVRSFLEALILNHYVLVRKILFLALGWHLEEIHVTWAYLEKKRTRLRFYTKYLEEPRIQSVETVSPV
ncbi:hypothetical protein Tco_0622227 [Tanacetum coccineum]